MYIINYKAVRKQLTYQKLVYPIKTAEHVTSPPVDKSLTNEIIALTIPFYNELVVL